MLSSLKKALNRDKVNTAVMEKALASVKDADVKDMFLDDVDSYLDGAEDDTEIGDLVEDIPEYDDEDVDDDDLEALDDVGESMIGKIPMTALTEDYSVFKGLMIGNAQIADDVYDTVEGDDEDHTTKHEMEESPEEEKMEEMKESSIEDIVSEKWADTMHDRDQAQRGREHSKRIEKEIDELKSRSSYLQKMRVNASDGDRSHIEKELTELRNKISILDKQRNAAQAHSEHHNDEFQSKAKSSQESFDSIEDLVNSSN